MYIFPSVIFWWPAHDQESGEHLLSAISTRFSRPDAPTNLFAASVSFVEGIVRAAPPRSAFCFKLTANYNLDSLG